ncbi:MAG: LamG domain-containing protein, partial [Candidatus Parcubacteria bacterium]|nr:LamG domain-containing protein [Candidatus Parcubacteria bacterium]
NINDNLDLFADENPSTNMGQINTVYVSLPSNQANCSDLSLPNLPTSWVYACKPLADYRKVDGTGWIPINFTNVTGYSLVSLPIDPKNNNIYYYAYVTGGSWSLSSLLESEKRLKEVATKDQGTDDGRYEIGSDLSLWSQASGLVGYWKFDEGSGTTTIDDSEYNHNGTITGATYVTGKVGGALSFNGTNNLIVVGTGISELGFNNSDFSVMVWIKLGVLGKLQSIVDNELWDGWPGWYLRIDASNRLVGNIRSVPDGAVSAGSISSNTFGVSSWNQVVMTIKRDSSTGIKLYINGNEVSYAAQGNPTLITTGIDNGSLGTAMGAYNYASGLLIPFTGMIDDVRIYNRVLSVSEIQSLYNATK